MIVSHRHKFIFVKTQKTAGTSIEIALSSICGPEDIITPVGKDEQIRKDLGYPGPQNTVVPRSRYSFRDWVRLLRTRRPVRFYNHTPARTARRWLGRDIWNSYYKFSFERNPYDKVVSHYYWRGGDEKFGSISTFLKTRKSELNRGMRRYGINGQIAVDQIFKFEELDQAMEDISRHLNLETSIQLPSVKAKSHKRPKKQHFSEILSEQDKALVRKRHAFEFKKFNYRT